MTGLALGWRILRADRRSRITTVLTALGVAVATALSVLLLSLSPATSERADRAAWQQPGAVDRAAATALVVRSEDLTGTDTITRLDVAALGSDVPLAPGIPRLPGPGEVLLSPELAARASAVAPEQLADRFPGTVVGTLDPAALSYPEQLVAVVGHTPSATALGERATPVAGLATGRSTPDFLLAFLAGVGMVVLVVPCAVLVGSVARLTAARRERRLAALRLAGATPGQVIAVTVAETTVAAVSGTLLGLVAGWPLRLLVAQVPWGGGTWQPADFAPPASVLVGVGVGIPLLVVAAATLALRRVVTAPITAAQAHRRRGPRAWRLLVLVAVGLLFALGVVMAQRTGSITLVLAGIAAIALSASVVGPLVTAAVGWVFTRVWRRPATLLAGRRLRDDPRAGYRAASGVVLAVFVGTMALSVLPAVATMAGGYRSFTASTLYVDLPASEGPAAQAAVQAELDRYGVSWRPVLAGRLTVLAPDGASYPALAIDCAAGRALTRVPIGDCTGAPGIRTGPDTVLPAGGLRVQAYQPIDTAADAPSGALVATPGDADAPPLSLGAVPVHRAPASTPGSPDGPAEDLAGTVLVDPAAVPDRVIQEVSLAVPSASDADREVVRTAVLRALPGMEPQSVQDDQAFESGLFGDLRRVTVIGLAVAAVLAGLSAGVTAAGSVIDRRRSIGALLAAGTPSSVLARALRTEAALPALVATLGAGVAGIAVAGGLLSVLDVGLVPGPWLAAPVALGILVALLATTACGPMLRRVAAEPLSPE